MKKFLNLIDNHKFLVIIIFIFIFYSGTVIFLFFQKTYFAVGLFFFSMVFTLIYVENYYKTITLNGKLEYHNHLKNQVDCLKLKHEESPDDVKVKAWYEAMKLALIDYETIVFNSNNKLN